mmetsp:Transcript_119474/g.343195  ORF Transcript_119474/g.343195 Transcript_119474/m.343195 type:complete len:258 (-) Transcript_119474:857-1630(-)
MNPWSFASLSNMRWWTANGASSAPRNVFMLFEWQTISSLFCSTPMSWQPWGSWPCFMTRLAESGPVVSRYLPSLLPSMTCVTKRSPHHSLLPMASWYIFAMSVTSSSDVVAGTHAKVKITTALTKRMYKSPVGEWCDEYTIRPGSMLATHRAKSCMETGVVPGRLSSPHSAIVGSKSGVPCNVREIHGAMSSGHLPPKALPSSWKSRLGACALGLSIKGNRVPSVMRTSAWRFRRHMAVYSTPNKKRNTQHTDAKPS